MEALVFRALHKQFMFFSDNGKAEIEHPAIAISEACKCCGKSRQDMREAFHALEEHGFIERVDQERLVFRMTKKGITQNEVEALIKTLTAA